MNLKKYIKLKEGIEAKNQRTEKEELLYQQLLEKVQTETIKEKAEVQEGEKETDK